MLLGFFEGQINKVIANQATWKVPSLAKPDSGHYMILMPIYFYSIGNLQVLYIAWYREGFFLAIFAELSLVFLFTPFKCKASKFDLPAHFGPHHCFLHVWNIYGAGFKL